MCCSSCWHRLLLECVARGQRACFATPPVQPPNQEWVNSTPWPTLLAALANCSEEDAMASVFKDFSKLGQGRFGKVFKLPTVALKIKRRASDMEAVALQAALNQDHILQRLHFEQSPLHEVLALELCECSLADSPGQTTSFPFWSRDLIPRPALLAARTLSRRRQSSQHLVEERPVAPCWPWCMQSHDKPSPRWISPVPVTRSVARRGSQRFCRPLVRRCHHVRGYGWGTFRADAAVCWSQFPSNPWRFMRCSGRSFVQWYPKSWQDA